jgi:hypothetical protein
MLGRSIPRFSRVQDGPLQEDHGGSAGSVNITGHDWVHRYGCGNSAARFPSDTQPVKSPWYDDLHPVTFSILLQERGLLQILGERVHQVRILRRLVVHLRIHVGSHSLAFPGWQA